MTYSFDTSGLLDGWRRYYPVATFPTIWENVESLIAAGRGVASDEVLHELEAKDDDLLEWARQQDRLFVPATDDIQVVVRRIMEEHGGLVDPQRGRSQADPFVIAVAAVHGAAVVTGEMPTRNPANPKIPDVCGAMGIECVSFLDLLTEEGWVY